jgi:peptidyl-prolyl cis-trans isomerase C
MPGSSASRHNAFLAFARRRTVLWAALLFLALGGCFHRAPEDRIVGHLGRHPITIRDLQNTAGFMGLNDFTNGEPSEWPGKERDLVLRETVQDLLLEREARKRHIAVDPKDVESFSSRHFPELSDLNPLPDNPGGPDLKTLIRKRLLIEKTVDSLFRVRKISQSVIRNYYRSHPDRFQKKEEAVVDHIVVAREDEAKTIHDALSKGASFKTIARLQSLGTEARDGGRMKPYARGTFPPPFDSVFSLKPGQISDVLSSSYGYHVFRLEQILPGGPVPLSDARKSILRTLRHKQARISLDNWLSDELRIHVFRPEKKYEGIFHLPIGYNGKNPSSHTSDPIMEKSQNNR